MTKQPFHVAALALAACSAAACTKQEPERSMTPASYTPPATATAAPRAAESRTPPGSPGSYPTPSTMTDSQGSVRAVAAARCEREVRCENVGQEKEYVTEEDCMVALEPDTQQEMAITECPGGYSAIELNECVEEIRAESCDTPLEDIARVAECRMTELCPG